MTGAPIEDLILLANMVGFNPWFCMPYNADETYVRNFAQLVRDTLRPDVQVYVEYSNEVWHTGFISGQYAQSMVSCVCMCVCVGMFVGVCVCVCVCVCVIGMLCCACRALLLA